MGMFAQRSERDRQRLPRPADRRHQLFLPDRSKPTLRHILLAVGSGLSSPATRPGAPVSTNFRSLSHPALSLEGVVQLPPDLRGRSFDAGSASSTREWRVWMKGELTPAICGEQNYGPREVVESAARPPARVACSAAHDGLLVVAA